MQGSEYCPAFVLSESCPAALWNIYKMAGQLGVLSKINLKTDTMKALYFIQQIFA